MPVNPTWAASLEKQLRETQEALRQRDSTRRPRKPLDTLLFAGTWAKPWSPAVGDSSTSKIQ